MQVMPLLNLRRWISEGLNPCAPLFNPSRWNDGVKNKLLPERVFTHSLYFSEFRDELLPEHVRDQDRQILNIPFVSFLLRSDGAQALMDEFQISEPAAKYTEREYKNAYGNVQYSNNCYSYMWDDCTKKFPGDKPHVGYRSGIENSSKISDIFEYAAADGVEFCGSRRPAIKDDFYIAAFFMNEHPGVRGELRDFHWIREDRSGFYSHKDGFDAVRCCFRVPEKTGHRGNSFYSYVYVPAGS